MVVATIRQYWMPYWLAVLLMWLMLLVKPATARVISAVCQRNLRRFL
jgi:hypothetical protein